MIALPALAQLAAARPAIDAATRCELCAAPIAEPHRHVVELGRRGVLCTCAACTLLFANGEPGARYRAVPDRVRVDPELALSAAEWARLGIPVGLALVRRDSATAQTVLGYPGPAGIVEAELDDDTWQRIAAATPLAGELADDVEALVIRGARGEPRLTGYIVPISAAFELVARLRASWQGLTGGGAAERELAAFFADLDRRARPARVARGGRG